jgi:hypothetical protein
MTGRNPTLDPRYWKQDAGNTRKQKHETQKMEIASQGFWFQNSLEFRDKRWEIMLDGIPQNIEIHLVIAMDKTVSHPNDLRPRNPRILSAPLRANPNSRLTDDFNQTNQCEFKHPVFL